MHLQAKNGGVAPGFATPAAAAAAVAAGTPQLQQQPQQQPAPAARAASVLPGGVPHYTPRGLDPNDPRLVRMSAEEWAALPTAPAPRGSRDHNPFVRLCR